ncbi:MAG: 1-acyl-sn-glycerol-3-phosphate acyltransferase [Cytophagales bacterium]|nr:1-acyl-sn-glycerol-3-phosphate acyltransferase [Cytophagales bacterium]
MRRLTRIPQVIDTSKTYEPILFDDEVWPVVKLAKNRKEFIERVTEESFRRLKKLRPNLNAMIEELELTRYREKLRYKTNPWKVDPDDEVIFWNSVKSRLVDLDNADKTKKQELVNQILWDIVHRYVQEITGNFKPSHYRLARRIIKFGFARLLNAARIKKFGSFWRGDLTLQDKIQITGEAEQLRKLAKIGTVVIVPTHFSNLDSILIGWVIHTLGLPPFIYGAGLNLFNMEIFAYFMNSLGAYKVDRRKKNLIYLESLRTYSSMALQDGCHSLFFPGGTRSRSGKLENRLKLGLLGTAIEAQRINYEKGEEGRHNKIFIVPVVTNYNFVLEAPVLIRNYLERKGQERYYVESDRYDKSGRILKFLIEFFTKGNNISVSIGRGLDLFGNYVNDEGMSIDSHGNRINSRDYFLFKGKISADVQREEEYTRMLSEVIIREYHRINRVQSSHLVAFTAFRLIRNQYKNLDLYSVLRLPTDEIEIKYSDFRRAFSKLRNRIIELFNEHKVDMATHLTEDLDKVIDLGITNVGMYHSRRPLLKNKKGNIITQDINNMYYYHNRMDGYELEKFL